jgi:drug/metabolite transporter (DMT)-like permease
LQRLNKLYTAHIALILAQVVYAMNYSIAKDLMPNFIQPFALVFMRITGAAILFWLLSLFTIKEKVARKDMKKFLWLALFGVVINQVFFIWGLSLTKPINSAIIMISNPIMVFIFTLIVLKEKITVPKISGLFFAMAGAYIILRYRGNFELGSNTILGDLMTLVNSASWAIFVVMSKPLYARYSTVTVMKWLFLIGSIYIIPVGSYDMLYTNWHLFTNHAWLAAGFVVVATTFLAYLLNIYGLKQLSPNVVSMYIYLQPFLASLFAISLGKDKLDLTKIIAGIFIILGLYLVTLKRNKTAND